MSAKHNIIREHLSLSQRLSLNLHFTSVNSWKITTGSHCAFSFHINSTYAHCFEICFSQKIEIKCCMCEVCSLSQFCSWSGPVSSHLSGNRYCELYERAQSFKLNVCECNIYHHVKYLAQSATIKYLLIEKTNESELIHYVSTSRPKKDSRVSHSITTWYSVEIQAIQFLRELYLTFQTHDI